MLMYSSAPLEWKHVVYPHVRQRFRMSDLLAISKFWVIGNLNQISEIRTRNLFGGAMNLFCNIMD